MPWISCPCFNIGWSVASVQQKNSWNVSASLQQICRRLVNGAIKGKSANGGLDLNTEVFKKWTVGLFLLGQFGVGCFLNGLVWDFCLSGVFLVKIGVLCYFSQLLCTTKGEGLKRSSCFETKWHSVAMQCTLLINLRCWLLSHSE